MRRRIDLFSIFIVCAVPLTVSAAGCVSANASVSSSTDLRSERHLILDRIASDCGLPRTALVLSPGDELHLQPPPDTNYESVDCALRRLRETGLTKTLPMGFVGNEMPSTNDAAPH